MQVVEATADEQVLVQFKGNDLDLGVYTDILVKKENVDNIALASDLSCVHLV